MTLFELVIASQGEAQAALAVNETGLTILTGYLLIAYFTGAKLTLFQVSLVNTIFVLGRIASVVSGQSILARNAYYNRKIAEIDPSIPMGSLSMGDGTIFSFVISILITLGCLIFMWQVRHPKD